MEFFTHPSGARVLFLPSRDGNKVFSVNFATPPSDDSGAAHAVEHCVLRGSRAYPAGDPFGELSAGYLYTYLNATTFPDRTVYPAASLLDGAFYRMLDVYMDAAFAPLLTEDAFRQEVCGEPGGGGVIRSETAAFFSDPVEILRLEANRRLFRGSPYEYFAPGTPEGLDGLGYGDFLAYHGRFYEPGNCFIYLYGNLDFDRAMSIIEPHISSRNASSRNADNAQCRGAHCAPAAAGTPAAGTPAPATSVLSAGTSFSLAARPPEGGTLRLPDIAEPCAGVFFKVCPVTDVLSLGALEILRLFLGGGSSAFTRAVTESLGRGAEIQINADGREAVFCVIFRGCCAPHEKVREAVASALRRAAADVGGESLGAAAAGYRFSVAEAKTGYKPRGLVYGLRMYQHWLLGGEQAARDSLKTASAAGALGKMPPDFYADFLIKRLAENAEAAALTVLPETKERRGTRLPASAQSACEKDMETSQVSAGQSPDEYKPVSAPAPFAFPRLSVKRSEIAPDFVPVEYDDSDNIPVLRHRLETRGVAYISAFFSLAALPPRLLAAAPFAARFWGKLPANGKSAREADLFLRRNFGELRCGVCAYPVGNPGDGRPGGETDFAAFFRVRAKMDAANAPRFFGALRLLSDARFPAGERPEELAAVKDLLREALAETGLSLRKPEAAARRSLAMFLPEAAFMEQADGGGFAEALSGLLDGFDGRYPALYESLREFARILPGNLAMISVGGKIPERFRVPPDFGRAETICPPEGGVFWPDEKRPPVKTSAEPVLTGRRRDIPAPPNIPGVLAAPPQTGPNRAVRNLAQSFPLVRRGGAPVLACALKNHFLLNEVRLKNGAYGADCEISRRAATLTAFSDPDPQKTLDTFRKIPDYIRRVPAEETRRSAVAALNAYLRPLHPEERVELSLERHFSRIGAGEIEKEVDGIFSASPEDLHIYADLFENGLDKGFISVMPL